jgi:hypothetical protein
MISPALFAIPRNGMKAAPMTVATVTQASPRNGS